MKEMDQKKLESFLEKVEELGRSWADKNNHIEKEKSSTKWISSR